MLEGFYKNKKSILKKTQKIFSNSSSLIPKIGIELEFFLLQNDSSAIEDKELLDELLAKLKTEITKNFLLIKEIEKEQGVSQFEIKTSFTSDLLALGEEIEKFKEFIQNFAQEKNLITSFSSQPFIDDCGSSLQFNISLHDQNQNNLLESDNQLLKDIATALLDKTDNMMIFLAPNAENYLRFSYELNRNLFKKGKFSAPVNLSFGSDNRTCAIRIPAVKSLNSNYNYGKRIEYRIAAAEADFFLCASALLIAINFGINGDKSNSEQIFGNAFDEQYKIKNFCDSKEIAEEVFLNKENQIRLKMLEFIS